MTTQGRCLCGNITWAFSGEMIWGCYCHCDDCRRNCSAPVVAWLGVPLSEFAWTGEQPSTYQSSPGVRRHFCSHCGTPMGFEADHYAGGMHLYAASMDNPEAFVPTFHVNIQSKLSWLALDDELTRHEGTLLHAPEDLSDYDC